MRKRLTNFLIVTNTGEYSANPSDYFWMNDTDHFEGNLVATEHGKGGWNRRIIVKKKPTKADLKKVL